MIMMTVKVMKRVNGKTLKKPAKHLAALTATRPRQVAPSENPERDNY